MIVLRILSGSAADQEIPVRRFPFTIGRRAGADLISSEPGVWDAHAQIELDGSNGFQLRALSDAAVLVNGNPTKLGAIRNGDSLRLGGLELLCWLAPARQKRLWISEGFTWTLIGLVGLAQVIWLYQLLLRT